MASYNKVLLMGNLTRDIELRSVGSGQQVAKISIAVNRSFTLPSGEKREEVTYVDCEAWGKQAETMAKYLVKGRPIFIEGRLKLDQWEDKNGGGKRSAMRVVVEEFRFVDSRPGGGGGGGGGGGDSDGWSRGNAPSQSAHSGGGNSGGGGVGGYDSPEPQGANDDIPF